MSHTQTYVSYTLISHKQQILYKNNGDVSNENNKTIGCSGIILLHGNLNISASVMYGSLIFLGKSIPAHYSSIFSL